MQNTNEPRLRSPKAQNIGITGVGLQPAIYHNTLATASMSELIEEILRDFKRSSPTYAEELYHELCNHLLELPTAPGTALKQEPCTWFLPLPGSPTTHEAILPQRRTQALCKTPAPTNPGFTTAEASLSKNHPHRYHQPKQLLHPATAL
jgi:hypothetical protein